MTAKEYVLENLHILTGKFPRIRVRYEHDTMAEVHLVEVVPNETYHLDDNYIRWEEEMTDKFIELFPTQNICFVSDDDLVGVRKAEYVFEGLAFMSSPTVTTVVIAIEPIAIAIGQLYTSTTINIAHVEPNNQIGFMGYTAPSSSTYRLAA